MARILIVEDEGILALKARLDLEMMGHEVVGMVDNGKDAIEAAKMERPDIILMDIVLKGGMSGIEASEAICENSGSTIIYMTAHSDNPTVASAKCTRPVGFLFKPFASYQLKRAIDKAIE